MPKLRTNSGAKKRFKITKSGKVMKKRAFARHNLEGKQHSRKLRLRKQVGLNKVGEKIVKTLMPYK